MSDLMKVISKPRLNIIDTFSACLGTSFLIDNAYWLWGATLVCEILLSAFVRAVAGEPA